MLKNLQSLRAFAAINVVFFHILLTSLAYDFPPKLLGFLSGWGANGVDIFFVLSGFVMLHTQLQNKRDPISFMKSRLIRIVPIYWLVTIAVIAFYSLIPSSVFNSNAPALEAIFQSLLFVRGAISGNLPVLPVGWTLEWEMLFYVLFGTALMLSNWTAIYAFILVTITIAAIFTNNLIAFEFILGMVVAYLFNKYPSEFRRGMPILVIGCLGLIASIFFEFDKTSLRFFVWGIPSAFIVAGAVYTKPISNGTLHLLGDASYSIYLVHFPIVSFFYKFSTYIDLKINFDILAIICATICISVGLMTYIFFEKPMMNYLKSTTFKR